MLTSNDTNSQAFSGLARRPAPLFDSSQIVPLLYCLTQPPATDCPASIPRAKDNKVVLSQQRLPSVGTSDNTDRSVFI